MSDTMYRGIFHAVDVGILVLDRDYRVVDWNRWLEVRSGIAEADALRRNLFELFPNLDTPLFRRSCRSVFAFGNFAYFSQKIHGYLIPIESRSPIGNGFDHMQQNCTLGPVRSGIEDDGERRDLEHAFLMVQDVTDIAAYELRLSALANTDGLTGAYNRPYLDRVIEREISRHTRHGRSLSVIMIDLDRFKAINDSLGHRVGDSVLREVALQVIGRVRASDTVARYGGEEFCVVLPETSIREALAVAEQLRSLIERTSVVHEETTVSVTASFGVAELRPGAATVGELLGEADLAMYGAKDAGRNCVISAEAGRGGVTQEQGSVSRR